MTVTSGKDVCRRIGHSDEADGENQENAYIHDRFALDAGYANYIRETVPKTTWSKDYLQELWDEETKYLKSIRESKMDMVSMILEWELHMPILLCIKNCRRI